MPGTTGGEGEAACELTVHQNDEHFSELDLQAHSNSNSRVWQRRLSGVESKLTDTLALIWEGFEGRGMDVRDGVYTYDLPWSYGGFDEPLSVHVIETGEATVLFGAGMDDTADDLVEAVSDHDIDVVLVEHGDVDHYGGVPALRDAWDVEVAVPAGDAQFLETADIEADHLLDGGETYWGVETVPAPGHTPDNMSYRFEDVLVAGDSVCGSNSPFAAEGDWSGKLAPLLADFNNDDSQTIRSISNLLDVEYDVVLTSHGQNVLEGGYAEVERLVAEL